MRSRPLTKRDYDEIVGVIDHWWEGPTTALAHPMFFYELGRLARVVESDEGKLVGFLLGFVADGSRVGYVHLVGIHPEWRRKGVARLLYRTFEADCRAEGCTGLKAISTLGNEGSVLFHEALGWAVREAGDYAGPGRARVVFEKAF